VNHTSSGLPPAPLRISRRASVVPSANVTSRPLNARACGSFVDQPEMVMVVRRFKGTAA
jgi:hypothetical protein